MERFGPRQTRVEAEVDALPKLMFVAAFARWIQRCPGIGSSVPNSDMHESLADYFNQRSGWLVE